MSNMDIINIAVKSLFKRRLRTFLTIFGVVVGTSSILIMLSLGFAMSASYKEILKSIGDATIIEINPSFYADGSASAPPKGTLLLDDLALDSFNNLEHIVAISPTYTASLSAKSGKYESWCNIIGIDLSVAHIFGYSNISQGRMITPEDKKGMIYGISAAYNFYDPKSKNNINSAYFNPTLPLDQQDPPPVDVMKDKIILTDGSYVGEFDPENPTSNKPTSYKANVVGILDSSDLQNSYNIYMNIDEVKQMKLDQMKKNSASSKRPKLLQYDMVKVKVDKIENVEAVTKSLQEMGFQVYSPIEFTKPLTETSKNNQTFLGFIGAVSLFISAIGITNTMIMSIYERTREIGIMKVIGATISDIRRIFLLEAGLIGFFGGIFGIGFSYLISFLLNRYGANFMSGLVNAGFGGSSSAVSIIPIYLPLYSLIFATLIGLVAGYLPARRATKLRAIDAIRTE